MRDKSASSAKGIVKNVLFGFSSWILPLLLSFFATPIIVGALGNEDYGIYALVLGFIGYSFNFSIGRAITKYVAEYLVEDQFEKIREVISATLVLNLIVGLIGFLTIFLLTDWFVKDLFQIQEFEAQSKTKSALYISAAIIFFTMLNQVFNSIIQGLQRFDVYSKIFNFQSFFLLTGNVLLAISGYGLLALLFWNLIIIIITCLVVGLLSKRLLPEFKFTFQIRAKTIRLVLKYSSAIIVYQIMANFLLLFERGWIMRKLGAENLTFYIIPMMLGIYLHSFITSLLLVIFPLASELNKNREKLLKLYLKAIKMIGFLVIFIGTTLIVINNEFLFLWMGEEFSLKSSKLLIIHILAFSLLSIQIASWQITEGLGYPNYNSYIFSVCLAISLILMVLLVEPYGNLGVAVGRLIGFGILFLSVFYVEKWFFGKIQFSLWFKIFGILVVSAIASSLIIKTLISQMSLNWLTLLVSIISGGIVYVFFVWIFGFINQDDKLILKNLMNSK